MVDFCRPGHIYIYILACKYVSPMYVLTIFNIYGSVLSIRPYDIVSPTVEDITIACISYCDSRNMSSSWIRWSITEPLKGYRRWSINNLTINYDNISTINIRRCSYFNSLVASCDNRWSWYKWSFINDWWIYVIYNNKVLIFILTELLPMPLDTKIIVRLLTLYVYVSVLLLLLLFYYGWW